MGGEGGGDTTSATPDVSPPSCLLPCRSRPVLRVTPHLTFEPPVIPTRWVDCSNVTASTVTLRLCLHPPGPGRGARDGLQEVLRQPLTFCLDLGL